MPIIHLLSFSLLCILTFGKPLGTPVVVKRQDATPTSSEAAESTICGDIVVAANNNYSIFLASDVYECLQSVPFNGAVAARFIDYYNETLQFQSTLAYLKDPPQGYQQPAVDVDKVLAAIRANATAGVYPNQYAFEADVQLLVNRMHDSHVILGAGALQAFSFASPYGIISASIDGKNPPEVFITDHVIRCQRLGCEPSPVTHINGVDVVDYLTQYAELNSQGYLEPHADWNTLMDSPVRDVLGDLSVFQSGDLYPGDSLNFTFKDHDPIDTYWLSLFLGQQDTGPLTTGGDFYNFFVLGLLPASYNDTEAWWPIFPSDNTTSDSNSSDFPPVKCSSDFQNWCDASRGGFPDDPLTAQHDLSVEGGGVVSGYIYDDISTGILSIPTFAQSGDNTEYFQDAVSEFIGNATSRNTSHIIIDLQQHTGGTIFLAFQTFKQFFATIDPYASSRIRSHHLANVLGSTYTEWWDQLEKDLADEGKASNYEYYASSEWVVTNRINTATDTNFSSWEQYSTLAGPVVDHNDTFSIPQRYNLSDEVFDASAFNNWIPFGYGIAKPPAGTPLESYQHWRPEDIVILTDGLCSSACSLFVEMMTHQAGVRTIVIGGRPVTGPMQAVSGTRAARVYSADAVDDDIANVDYDVDNEAIYKSLPNRSDTGMWVTYAGFSIADQMRKDDPVPLQFKYEAADCRLYYTIANVYNMTRLWRDVSDAAWRDTSLCVQDSTGYPTARNSNANNSTKPPPARTAQVPNLTYDLAAGNRVSVEVNSTGGLFDGIVARSDQAVTPCKNGKCDGDTPCSNVPLNCGTDNHPSYKLVQACTPKCQSNSGCTGTNVECIPGRPLDSKSNSAYGFGQKSTSSSPSFNGVLREKLCTPLQDLRTLKACGNAF